MVQSGVFSENRHLIGERSFLNAWYTVIRSPLLRLSAREHRFIGFCLSGYDGLFLPNRILVAFLCTASNKKISPWRTRLQTSLTKSRMGLTYVLYIKFQKN